MSVANCKRCNKVFSKAYSPFCPECHEIHMGMFSKVFRFLQDKSTPKMTLEDIADHCQLPLKQMEDIFFGGELGTASHKVIYNCQLCDIPIAPVRGRGKFCFTCTDKLEGGEAKREERAATYAQKEQERLLREKQAKLKKVQEIASELNEDLKNHDPSSREHFGFKRF